MNLGSATRFVAAAVALALLSGCGSDYRPPEFPTTGVPAGPLGQVIDIEASLPLLRVVGSDLAGVELELRIELERVGFGEIPARVEYGRARLPMDSAEVDDLSDGRTTVTVTPDRWQTGRLGPLRIDGTTTFELVLDGTPHRKGWRPAGRAWESRGSTFGAFEGWRRHRFLVSGSDFLSSTGRVSEVSLVKEAEIRVRPRLELVSSDADLAAGGGAVFAINRFTFDNLQRLDPLSAFATSWQASMGAGSNPQDVVQLTDDKAYVTRYEPPYDDVAVFDPRRGTLLASIPLGPFAENGDGVPRPQAMAVAEGAVFVALQDIDRSFIEFAEGKLAVIDPFTDAVVGIVPLGGKNPSTIREVIQADGRRMLYVALSGIFPGLQAQELSGGVVVVDALDRVVAGLALDDDDAGGNVGALAMVSERLGYVVVSDAQFANRVIAFDPRSAATLRTLRESPDYIPQIDADGDGLLAIPDRNFYQPGLCLYRTPETDGAVESLVGCASLELPPFAVEALD